MRSPHHDRRWRSSLAAAAVLATLLAGCAHENDERAGDAGSSRQAGAFATTQTAESAATDASGEDPATAYAAWVGALARRDAAEACARQAPEFTIALRYAAIGEDRAQLGDACTVFEALVWEDPDFASEIVDIAVTQQTAEDALLAVTLGAGEDTAAQTVRMVYHRARWRVLSTADRTSPTDRPDPGSPAGEASGPARWLGAWCDLAPTMSAEEIITLMGPPSGEYTVSDGGEPQLWWAQDQYDFRVYLDVDGSVLDLVGDYDALSVDDRSGLTCPELR